MTSRLYALSFDASDPPGLARFWAGVLRWEVADDPDGGVSLLPTDDTGFRLRFLPTQEQKVGQNRMHVDLTSSSLEDQQQTVAKALALGGRHVQVGQLPEEEHVVLADPEGNEFCVIEPGNNFLADCGFVGALACDGSQEVGYFWRDALDWPLVWDQDEETAIQAPDGSGPKVQWSGRPLMPKSRKERIHLHVAPDGDTSVDAALYRLVSLGATRLDDDDIRHACPGAIALADVDGNELCLVTS